ncbi:MAG: DUF1367 family protein [Acidobacteria bacterium Pan2503]|uniref:DUF1367 family protein n=1 Tax=Candidatus Acidiferrum panamense TaxID=2741543 RepID=A0A7V8SWR7_9BACT|nr:DUF1367 family protein [Candidatus Acidoferrum panamensis]
MKGLFTRMGSRLVPVDEEAQEWLLKLKPGQAVMLEGRIPRNLGFHRKYFALVNLAYDYWSERVTTIKYKGERVLPDRERFRKDCIILAGFYRPVVNLKGEVRIEPESLKWSSMTEERFGELYDATINVLLRKVFNGKVCPAWTETELREVAERVLEFAA